MLPRSFFSGVSITVIIGILVGGSLSHLSRRDNQVPAPSDNQVPVSSIVFRNMVCDFGEIAAGEVCKVDFIFTNTGNTPVRLKSVITKCGCVAHGATDVWIHPGNTGKIPVELTTAGQSAPTRISKKILVQFENAGDIEQELMVKADVVPEILLVPEILQFESRLSNGKKEVSHRVIVRRKILPPEKFKNL